MVGELKEPLNYPRKMEYHFDFIDEDEEIVEEKEEIDWEDILPLEYLD